MHYELSLIFQYNRHDVAYNYQSSIGQSASTAFIPQNAVVVAYSQGGLLAREYMRQYGPQNQKALITVGTPNTGLPAITAVENGALVNLLIHWISELALGPVGEFGPYLGSLVTDEVLFALHLAGQLGPYVLQNVIEDKLPAAAARNDMKVNSPFLTTLNAAPNNTFPAARYAIYGGEDFYGYMRLIDSAIQNGNSGNPLESGDAYAALVDFMNIYLYSANWHLSISNWYYELFEEAHPYDPEKLQYLDLHYYHADLASKYWVGVMSLNYYQNMDFETVLIGSAITFPNGLEYSDALIPASRQAPTFFGAYGDRVLRADGANHLELPVHENSQLLLDDIFRRPEVNVPLIGSGGGGTPSPPQTPLLTGLVNNGHPVLSWIPETGVTSYEIHQKIGQGAWYLFDTTTSASYTDWSQWSPTMASTNDTTAPIAYRVMAIGPNGNSAHSNEIYFNPAGGGGGLEID